MRSFLAVAEELHFARAAARLGVEQSPLSRQIKDMEIELGVRLFHRTSRRTTLTPLGERFLSDARRILTDSEVSVQALRCAAKGDGAPFRLGVAEGAAGPRCGELIRVCAEAPSPITVLMVDQPTLDLQMLVATGALDAALMLTDQVSEDLACDRAWGTPMALAVGRNHDLAKQKRVRLSDLKTQNWILPDPHARSGHYQQVCDVLARHGGVPDGTTFITHQSCLIQLLTSGSGIALSTAASLKGHADIALILIDDPKAELVAWLVTRRDPCSPALERVKTLIEEIATSPP